jgi:hypothetical protein
MEEFSVSKIPFEFRTSRTNYYLQVTVAFMKEERLVLNGFFLALNEFFL